MQSVGCIASGRIASSAMQHARKGVALALGLVSKCRVHSCVLQLSEHSGLAASKQASPGLFRAYHFSFSLPATGSCRCRSPTALAQVISDSFGRSVQLRQFSRSMSPQQGPDRQGSSESDVKVRREAYDEITDKIPQRPVTAPEAAGWSVIIFAAYVVAAAIAYAVVTQLFMETPEVAAFNAALDKVREDPRITVRLGQSIKAALHSHTVFTPAVKQRVDGQLKRNDGGGRGGAKYLAGYGSDARGKAARHRISHRIYDDSTGQQHVQVQFHIAGNAQRGIVSADMYKVGSTWRYAYLYVDIEGRRLVLIEPEMHG